jgi:hypothetical protein
MRHVFPLELMLQLLDFSHYVSLLLSFLLLVWR